MTKSDDFSDLTDNPDANRESQELLGMLYQQRQKLSGEHQLPADDQDFDHKVLSDARSRSQEIRDAAALVAGTERHERIHAVPLWLKLCWILAILAVLALIIYSQSQGDVE